VTSTLTPPGCQCASRSRGFRLEDPKGKPVFTADGKPVFAWGYGPPKTKAGKRSIALDRGTVEALRGRRRTWAAEKVKAGHVYEDEDLVFCLGRWQPP
jgi:hypothetical protein